MMHKVLIVAGITVALWGLAANSTAGPYSNWNEGVEPDQCVAWASGWTNSYRTTNVTFGTENNVLGAPVDHTNVFSLGDEGYITVTFDTPIYDGSGADFAVWENGFNPEGEDNIFAELMFVRVSSDGTNWALFPSVSLTAGLVGPYGTINATDIYNLAGKHANAHGLQYGTPFDLNELTNNTYVLNGLVNLDNINFVRMTDVIGDGSTYDSESRPIYDPNPYPGTGLSWGADLEAVGMINMVPEPGASFLILGGLMLLVTGKRFFRK